MSRPATGANGRRHDPCQTQASSDRCSNVSRSWEPQFIAVQRAPEADFDSRHGPRTTDRGACMPGTPIDCRCPLPSLSRWAGGDRKQRGSQEAWPVFARAEALVLAYVQVIPREQTVTFGGSYTISPI
jgi:hypothetical protein